MINRAGRRRMIWSTIRQIATDFVAFGLSALSRQPDDLSDRPWRSFMPTTAADHY